MPPFLQHKWDDWAFPAAPTTAFGLLALAYVRGWLQLRSVGSPAARGWRPASFLLGLSLGWIAVASPIASCDGDLLTFHMIQHLLLMSVAPPLMLLGEPLMALQRAIPQRTAERIRGSLFGSPAMQRSAEVLGKPVVCWLAATATLVGWHVPSALTLGMQSGTWHAIEQGSFFGSGILFWWPVVRPWPSAATEPQWSIVLYLFLATLPCDILSGFLLFSERVTYPVYLSVPRHASLSVFEDQQAAGAVMWMSVTIIYLVAGALVTMRVLLGRSVQPRTPQRIEAV
jgi:putative membrane protein